MAEPFVREIGRVEDIDGDPCVIGVDYDTVTIGGEWRNWRFTQAGAEEFAETFTRAVWAAGWNAARMAIEADEADGGDTMHEASDE
jgi:hypothetical protein